MPNPPPPWAAGQTEQRAKGSRIVGTLAATAGRRGRLIERTCVACHRKGAKRALIRIVRGPSGGVDVDPSGRAPGRGAYLCPERRCWDTALRGARLSGALRATLRPEERERLGRHAATLPAAEEDASDGR